MPSETRGILKTFTAGELKGMAAQFGVSTEGCKSKNDLVKRLAVDAKVMGALRTPAFRVRPLLAVKTVPELQSLAGAHGVDVAGCERKADYLGRIAASPAAARILEGSPIAATPGPARPVEPAPALPDLRHDAADRLVLRGRNQDVDFGLVEDVLDQARMRFEERNYDRTLELAREALVLARGTLDAFERSAWAYALLASQRLIEESGRVGRDVEPAAVLLRDAKVAYSSGNLGANHDLLTRLQAATQALYSEEVQRLRQVMYAAQERISQTAHVGGDVGAADEALARARDAMLRGEHSKALQLVGDTERLSDEALARRVKEIGEMIPATEKAVEEASHVGADVQEAARLLEKAKVAMERREYVLAAELVQRAERASLQSQHYQIQKAMELRMRQIEKVQGLVNYLVPIVDEGAGYDLAIEEPRRLLQQTREVLDQGDYVNGTMFAKQAEEAVRPLVSRLVEERAKRGITKPPGGRCSQCGSSDISFLDDGWARCGTCSSQWRWRAPSGLWERFRSLLRE